MQTFQPNNICTLNNDFTSQGLASQVPNPLSETPDPLFSPFWANTLKVQGASGFPSESESICFSQRHNMIIACPLNHTMQFYDATTFLPFEERETRNLDGSVIQMSFDSESDTYLIGCTDGSLYSYNASRNELKRREKGKQQVLAATFLDSKRFVFSFLESQKLFLRTLTFGNVKSFGPYKSDIFSLQNLPQRNLLLSGLYDGSLMIYRTDKLPHLRVIFSVQAHEAQAQVVTIQDININGKECIVTASIDFNVKLWHLVKGRMRMLRVICCREKPVSLVYLENYKTIAISFDSKRIRFFEISSGKLKRTLSQSKDDDNADYYGNGYGLFLMKEKNLVGVTCYHDNVIKFFQLGGVQGGENKV